MKRLSHNMAALLFSGTNLLPQSADIVFTSASVLDRATTYREGM